MRISIKLAQFSPNLGILWHASLIPRWLCQTWISDCKCSYIHRSNSCFNICVSFIHPQAPFSIHYQALPTHSSLGKSKWLVPGVKNLWRKGEEFLPLPNKKINQTTHFLHTFKPQGFCASPTCTCSISLPQIPKHFSAEVLWPLNSLPITDGLFCQMTMSKPKCRGDNYWLLMSWYRFKTTRKEAGMSRIPACH